MNMRSIIAIIAGVVLVGGLAVAAITLTGGGEEEKTVDKQPQPSQEHPDWTTYRNQEFNFGFRYPPDWFVTDDESAIPAEVEAVLTNFEFPAPLGSELTGEQVRADFSVEENPNNLTLNEWVEQSVDPQSEVLATEGLTVAGEPAVKIRQRGREIPEISFLVLIEHEGQIYKVRWVDDSDDMLLEILETYFFTGS